MHFKVGLENFTLELFGIFFFLLPNRKRARKDVVTFFRSVVEQSSVPLLFVKFPEKSHLYLV